ncbi:membrane protein [Catellatospora sp. IY07-71]|uniref:hypothetical protein n=1 Tax=Catellatospora sp. IY07-71 TaxID=2728827 RepID=UPI001BB67C93|nr:hypothetical protein [Catellatospora sp. IY07-71]BCJ74649.1 membrane protein [Catellatospora sp. IY07-71]
MLVVSMIGALLAAVCFGLSSVMQAVGMHRAGPVSEEDPRSLVRAWLTVPFLAGTGLDLLGFGFELVALRHLPLFLVQAAVASALAVTAIAASVVMKERLGRGEKLAVVAVCLGLALLGCSAGPEGATRAHPDFYTALGASLLGLAVLGLLAGRLPGRWRTPILGLCAGLCFGVLALAARTLPQLDPVRLLREPATYLVAVSSLIALVLWTMALSAGAVTTATAAMVVGETVLPAVIGVLVLGDEARAGWAPVAVGGFLLAVGGALALARFGELRGGPAEGAAATAAPAEAGR